MINILKEEDYFIEKTGLYIQHFKGSSFDIGWYGLLFHLRIHIAYFRRRVEVTYYRFGKFIDDLYDQYAYVKDFRIQGTPDRGSMTVLDKIVHHPKMRSGFSFPFGPTRIRK